MKATTLIVAGLRWIVGCEPALVPSKTDDLEPYCTERVMVERMPVRLNPGEAKAIRKIGARYGAEL